MYLNNSNVVDMPHDAIIGIFQMSIVGKAESEPIELWCFIVECDFERDEFFVIIQYPLQGDVAIRRKCYWIYFGIVWSPWKIIQTKRIDIKKDKTNWRKNHVSYKS